MAKHKSCKPTGGNDIRVRFRVPSDEEARTILQKALKMDARRIVQRSVSHNQVEAWAEFSKKKDAKEFTTWLQEKRKNVEFVTDTEKPTEDAKTDVEPMVKKC